MTGMRQQWRIREVCARFSPLDRIHSSIGRKVPLLPSFGGKVRDDTWMRLVITDRIPALVIAWGSRYAHCSSWA
jgi:hypothetical protein